MSSLDHINREAVATRLVEEAEHRQVIVFTHDLTFLFELQRKADDCERSVHFQTVLRKLDRPGFVNNESPMKAKSGLYLANALRGILKTKKSHFDNWSDAERTVFCKGIFEQLREAWDQGIADLIFPVLGRFDNAIKGNSLYKLAIIEEDDVKTVTTARGYLSDKMHTPAETLNQEPVTHSELLKEVLKLETWLHSIINRQKVAVAPKRSNA